MAWDHLSINRPHLAYLILGGFTSLFMLVSLFVKQRLYIGEATVAAICGVIFGPNAADLLNPKSWGNTDQITLEFSRIVLVVQCFAVGVELPKAYMERHWKSVVLLLVPVMIYGWLATSLFVWWMVEPLSWLDSLCVAACVTATDPVLASSVVGKGKFAKRVPRHLRDLLSAESGCNDGMAFPFVYLALYLIKYRPHTWQVFWHWAGLTILYECIFGAIYGVLVGYGARQAIKLAEKHDLVDRESFLAFYFVLALFCAGSGSLLGLDDLLVGFAAGVGFSNDGWFRERTEESHVSDVIDLLLNLAYFVYFGAIVPWGDFSLPDLGLTPWRLVVIAILVILFRRIPIMLLLKPVIPDVKTWREALFAGHFGPIGVGAIFVAILARAELSTGSTTPLAELPPEGAKNRTLVVLIWPIVTFLVISSMIVHGSSIAVFALGKHINTLTITMSYTQANEEGPSWMNRLPRIQSQSRKTDVDNEASLEKEPTFPAGTLPPTGLPGTFLRRQREEDNPSRQGSRSSSLRPPPRSRRREMHMGAGGPVSQSAIVPQSRLDNEAADPSGQVSPQDDTVDRIAERTSGADVQVSEEGRTLAVEDKEGDVVPEQKGEGIGAGGERADRRTAAEEGRDVLGEVNENVAPPAARRDLVQRLRGWDWSRRSKSAAQPREPEVKRGPAHAYQFGKTVIVEDEDGEVVRKFDIPSPKAKTAKTAGTVGGGDGGEAPAREDRQPLHCMGTWMGLGRREADQPVASAAADDGDDDDRLRFVSEGRRMRKADFIQQIQNVDPRARTVANKSEAPPDGKRAPAQYLPGAIGVDSDKESSWQSTIGPSSRPGSAPRADADQPEAAGLDAPPRAVGYEMARFDRDMATQRRREQALEATDDDSDDDGTERVPPKRALQPDDEGPSTRKHLGNQPETAAERRRREAALGVASAGNDSDEEEDRLGRGRDVVQEPARIRFADEPTQPRSRLEQLVRG